MKSMINSCTAVIIHYDSLPQLKQLLDELGKQAMHEVVIVDNFSSKNITESVQRLCDSYREKGQKIFLITNHENLGFATACNQGAEVAGGEWLLFLNPDVTITPTQIRTMIKEATTRGYDAASPIPESQDYNKPLPTTLSLLAEFTPLKHFFPLSILKQKTLTGGSLLIKKSILEELGGWDEKFFLWFEDSDLTKRLIEGGYHIGWVSVKTKHEGGVSLKKMPQSAQRKIFFTSMQRYAHKHLGRLGQYVAKFLAQHYIQ